MALQRPHGGSARFACGMRSSSSSCVASSCRRDERKTSPSCSTKQKAAVGVTCAAFFAHRGGGETPDGVKIVWCVGAQDTLVTRHKKTTQRAALRFALHKMFKIKLIITKNRFLFLYDTPELKRGAFKFSKWPKSKLSRL